MSISSVPNSQQPKGVHLPHWVTPIVLSAAFLLIHIAAPWRLSLLSTRHGWKNGRPSRWNLLALILVIPGLAATIWMTTLHFRASPDTFLEFKQSRRLLTPGPYAFSRNPMYLIELSFWFGWALFYGCLAVFVTFLLWFALFNFVIVPYEERDLEARFGETYIQYENMVPRWL